MIVTTGVDEVELACFVKAPFCVTSCEKEAFDFVRGVERVTLLFEELVGVCLQYATKIAGIGFAILVDDGAEDDDFSRSENVGGYPIERAPVDSEAKIAFLLSSEAS